MVEIEGVDGKDHINVYSKGKTKLDSHLPNFAYSPISLEPHGKFTSIEGYWYWLIIYINTEYDYTELRKLYGFNAKKVGREYLKDLARDIKLKSNLSKLEELKISTLPLVHYYQYGDKKVTTKYNWVIEHLENRRNLLKTHEKEKKK